MILIYLKILYFVIFMSILALYVVICAIHSSNPTFIRDGSSTTYKLVSPARLLPEETVIHLLEDVNKEKTKHTNDFLLFTTYLFSYYPNPPLNLTSTFYSNASNANRMLVPLTELKTHLTSGEENGLKICRKIAALGGWSCGQRSDGTKPVCLDGLKPIRREDEDCLVYSFGVGNDLSFEKQISDFGCRVFVFDDDNSQNFNTITGSRVMFFKARLGSSITVLDVRYNDGREDYKFLYRPLDNIMFLLGHDKASLDILKIDIDGNEWDVFQQSICKTDILTRTNQLILEVHLDVLANFTNSTLNQIEKSIENYNGVLQCLKSFGFQLVTSWANELRPTLSIVQDIVFQVYTEQLWINTHYKQVRLDIVTQTCSQNFKNISAKEAEHYRNLIENLN